MSTRIISLCRVLTSLVPPVHNQGVSSAPLQGHALWNIFLPTTGSFFVCCITDFFPATGYAALLTPEASHGSSSRPVPAIPGCTLSPSSPCCFWKAPVQGGTSPFPVWPAASPLQTSGTSPVRSGTAWRLNVTAAVPEQLLSGNGSTHSGFLLLHIPYTLPPAGRSASRSVLPDGILLLYARYAYRLLSSSHRRHCMFHPQE